MNMTSQDSSEGEDMTKSKDQTGGMGKLSKTTRANVDAELADKEASLLADTSVNLQSLRPQVSDKESFDKLIKAVNASTQKNENIAQLKQRITDLGEGVVKVAKQVAGMVT